MSDGDHHPQICLITLSWIEAKKDRGNQDYSLGSEEHFLVYRGFQHSYPQDMSLVGHPGEQAGQNHSQLAHKESVAQREAGPHSQHPLEPGSLGVPSSLLPSVSTLVFGMGTVCWSLSDLGTWVHEYDSFSSIDLPFF